jgi:hypothetical protein
LIIEQRCDVQDEQLKAIAAEYLAKNLAAYVGTPDQKDLTQVAQRSLEQAEEWQREQLRRQAAQQPEQRPDEELRLQPESRQGERYYAELRETHRLVSEEITSSRVVPPERNNFENERDEPSHLGRYDDLETTHQIVDVELRQRDEGTARQTAEIERTTNGDAVRSTTEQVELKGEQSDSKRETDDRARARQVLMREFGREIAQENECNATLDREL